MSPGPASRPPGDLAELTARLRTLLSDLRHTYPIGYLGVFGSWVRGEQRADSDLDLLVEFDGPIDGFAYIRLQDELSNRLGLRVDLVERTGLKPFIGARVRAEVQPV